MYVQINIGSDQISESGQGFISASFADDTLKALSDSIRGDLAPIEVHTGTGTWNGVSEESMHISTLADVDTYALRVKLAEIKKIYHQDAIALIVGSDLI